MDWVTPSCEGGAYEPVRDQPMSLLAARVKDGLASNRYLSYGQIYDADREQG